MTIWSSKAGGLARSTCVSEHCAREHMGLAAIVCSPARPVQRCRLYTVAYDGCTPLRNPLWSKVTGTIGNVEYLNGKPVSTLDSWAACNVQHTFAIPGLGLSVPVASPTTLKENNNLCATAPCTSGPHAVV